MLPAAVTPPAAAYDIQPNVPAKPAMDHTMAQVLGAATQVADEPAVGASAPIAADISLPWLFLNRTGFAATGQLGGGVVFPG